MKNIGRIFFSILFAIHCASANADATNDCMNLISNDPDFQQVLSQTIFPDAQEITLEMAQQNKSKILGAVASTMFLKCPDKLSILAKQANGKIWYALNNKNYAIQFKMADLFQYTNMPLGIMIYNKSNLGSSDIIKLTDIKQLYWSDECSDHTIWDNLDDDTAVNIAGQAVFSQYGASENEFFIDFEEGNNRRAFPGLVLMDKTGSTTEKIVGFTNLHTAINAAQNFASSLSNTTCSNQGLAVYVVNLKTQRLSTSGKDGWAYTAGIAGATPILVGIGLSSALSAAGTALAATSAAVSSALGSTAGVLATVGGPYGWIAAGAIAAIAGAIALYPEQISDIKQVMVMDGPFLIQ